MRCRHAECEIEIDFCRMLLRSRLWLLQSQFSDVIIGLLYRHRWRQIFQDRNHTFPHTYYMWNIYKERIYCRKLNCFSFLSPFPDHWHSQNQFLIAFQQHFLVYPTLYIFVLESDKLIILYLCLFAVLDSCPVWCLLLWIVSVCFVFSVALLQLLTFWSCLPDLSQFLFKRLLPLHKQKRIGFSVTFWVK